MAAEKLTLLAVDDKPGESSDEEGGSSNGIRLRVRVSRSADEKWGITWHAGIFKSQQKLVVKDIAEGSVLARWNEGRPERKQLDYGDRLIRINGKRFMDTKAAETSDKMRAELKQPIVRMLFWRPGSALDDEKEEAAAEGKAETAGASSSTATCGAVAAATAAAAAGGGGGAVPDENEQVAKVEVVTQSVEVSTASPDEPPSADAQASDKIAEWTYSCRKCNTALFHDYNILPHFTDGKNVLERSWIPSSRKATLITPEASQEEYGFEGGGYVALVPCTSVFVEPMKWMGDLEKAGKLLCGNPRCRQKLGGYSWHGLPCSCGQWQSPAFQIHCARYDIHPAARIARGAPPERVIPGGFHE